MGTKAIGAQAPLGTYDPLGIFPDPTNADDEQFERLRWVELKHGRIAMLATVGYLTTAAGIRFPGAENIPGGFAALDNLPGMVWAQGVATLARWKPPIKINSRHHGVWVKSKKVTLLNSWVISVTKHLISVGISKRMNGKPKREPSN